MSSFKETKIEKITDERGVERTITIEKSSTITRNEEPDYVKLYTKVWLEFNGIPLPYRQLFLELVTRMTYCNANDLEHAQLVTTCKPFSDDIMRALKWKIAMFKRGLLELSKAGAIRRVGRGVYQINPSYAGKGEWKYNPKLKRGGVENLVATFNFKDKTVDTKVIWADDGGDTDMDKVYRDGLGVASSDEAVMISTITVPIANAKGDLNGQ